MSLRPKKTTTAKEDIDSKYQELLNKVDRLTRIVDEMRVKESFKVIPSYFDNNSGSTPNYVYKEAKTSCNGDKCKIMGCACNS